MGRVEIDRAAARANRRQEAEELGGNSPVGAAPGDAREVGFTGVRKGWLTTVIGRERASERADGVDAPSRRHRDVPRWY